MNPPLKKQKPNQCQKKTHPDPQRRNQGLESKVRQILNLLIYAYENLYIIEGNLLNVIQ